MTTQFFKVDAGKIPVAKITLNQRGVPKDEYRLDIETVAQDVGDDAQLIPDHADAWNVAHRRIAHSNLARAYVELRDLANRAAQGPLNVIDTKRLQFISTTNE